MQVIPILNSVSYPKKHNKNCTPVKFTARIYGGEVYSEWFIRHACAYFDKLMLGSEINEIELMNRLWAKELKNYKEDLVLLKTNSFVKGWMSRLFKKNTFDAAINETVENRAEEYIKLYRLHANEQYDVPFVKNDEVDFPTGKYSSAKDKELQDWAMTAKDLEHESKEDNRSATDIFFEGPM